MTGTPHREPDPELEAIRELGLIERQQRRAARRLGVSHGAMGVVWVAVVAILIAAAIAVVLAVR